MSKSIITVAAVMTAIAAGLTILNQSTPRAEAHCQVPCGIFDEKARIKALYEDATTIEKAMNEMNKLAEKDDAQSMQQFVRWTIAKEEHAARIITVTSEYFLTQKLKKVEKGDEGYAQYLSSLELHHELLIAAMKSKQTTDISAVKRLNDAIHGIQHVWEPDHKH
ncbi:MAG: superoxide dismutase [Ni] [Planctomycetota bacterium]